MSQNKSNIKFQLVRMENYVHIQFDNIGKIFKKLHHSTSPIHKFTMEDIKYGVERGKPTLDWTVKIYHFPNENNRVKLVRNLNKRYVNIYLNPDKEILSQKLEYVDVDRDNGGYYYGGGRRGYDYRQRVYRTVSIKNNKVIDIKFKNNTERDSFCNVFFQAMQELSDKMNQKKPTVEAI